MAPSGAAALDRDLAREDAAEGAGGAGGGAGAKFSGDEGEFVEASGDGAQKGEDVDEGAVVERDRVVVTTFEGEDLGPAAVGVLGCQEIVDTAGERRAPAVRAAVGGGGGEGFGEKAELGDGGVVVDGADVAGLVTMTFAGATRGGGLIRVFIPTAGGGLE